MPPCRHGHGLLFSCLIMASGIIWSMVARSQSQSIDTAERPQSTAIKNVANTHRWQDPYMASIAGEIHYAVDHLFELLSRARGGDREAMRTILTADEQCSNASKSTDEIAYRVAISRRSGHYSPEIGINISEHHLACLPYRQTVDEKTHREIWRLAAEAGDVNARSAYVVAWSQGIARDGAAPDEFDLYRDTSRRYMTEMFASGDLTAIGLYATAYREGLVFDRDVALQAAYLQLYAELDHGPNGNVMRMSLTKLDPLLDDAARERQRAMVERLRREFVCRTCAPSSSLQPPKG